MTIDQENERDARYRCGTCEGKGLKACTHESGEKNEYGDCLDCDGEGDTTCDCQR
jgi:hypothetical protein